MATKLAMTTLSLLLLAISSANAQRWVSRLPQKPEEELTFSDFQTAFRSYYGEKAVDVKKEEKKPNYAFSEAEKKEEFDIEEYKMFKRWEWFLEPRVYPNGKLDLEKISTIRAGIEEVDNDLMAKQSGPPAISSAKWDILGPENAVGNTNMGRVNCIQFDPGNTKTIYIGSPGGGVWKTTDAGSSWSPLFDSQPTLSVGDIAIDPKNTDIVYASTSDAFGYGVPFWGGTYSVGVRKSTNGGKTWDATGLKWTVSQNRTIRRLVIHPTKGNILLAATSNGLYRTDDGGTSWKQLWSTSTYDVEFQQNNGDIVYATTNQVLKSTNAGASFTALTASCPGTRYNIKIARSNPDVLYALCTTGDLQKSTDAGHTWTTMPASGVSLYGYYDDVLAVSPVDDKIVYVAGFDIKKSDNGGTTWSSVNPIGHVDNHCIEFFPGSKSDLLFGNDGGVFKTTDAGSTWSSLNKSLAITQFYSAGSNKKGAIIVVAGAQDNGNMKYDAGAFSNITGADGMDDFVDWNNDNNIYASIQYGDLLRSTNGGASFTDISTPASGAWTTPWCQDPKTANTLFAATDKVYKSTNQGSSWAAISGALPGGGTYTVLAVADKDPKVIYAGSGTILYRTTTGGAPWTNISAGLPVATNYLTRIAINDNNADVAYATFSGYVAGEKVYKTVNGGTSWTNISGSLPNMPVDCIVYENSKDDALYIGTDAGVYYRNNSMNNWIPYKTHLPNVIVDDLTIHYGTKQIIAATYGRGIWRAPLK